MAKKLINKIAEKLKKMNEEIKNEQPEVNTEHTEEQQGAEPTTEAQPQADNITEPAAADWEAKYNEANDKYLRLYSEFDNYRRRSARERIDLVATAGADMLKNILPVVDDFDRALKNMETAADVLAVREGVELIYSKLKNTLQGKGLEEMKAVGEPFDADIHEAITQIPVTDENMKGKVVEELEKGYYLHGKVVRYAKVIVGA
ncbi:MAG: nucleotide exchange factor GrpE [Sphingobacteriales bacterium JAD_PAG50586_3]|nr:MAG: nucleotide exchange factor GrpE [Sphingobacteriales bacterium JAD_PAG50586_3]